MYANKLLCFLSLIVFAAHAKAQSPEINTLDSFSAKLITGIRTNEHQRAYLVTDRSMYKAGEYVWFKAFLLDAASLKLSHQSRFLFVDIVNDKDNVIKHMILDVADDQFGYRIHLPDSLAGGYYWLRAYTKQMAENDTNNICVKPLYIVSRINTAYLSRPKNRNAITDEEPVINFYPEGGSIQPGINCTVALLASQKNGKPLNIDGYIKDSYGAVAARFKTNATGLGKFEFEASGYRQYAAIINWRGKEINYPLPPFNFYSGQLSVSKQSSLYKLRILLGDSIYRKDAVTYVVGISRDSLAFASIGKGQYETTVDERLLPDGITSFYLFDKNFKLLSERSIYVHAHNINVNITTDKNVYSTHDKVLMSLSATDATQRAVPSLVAVSVSDSIFSYKLQQCSFGNMPSDLRLVDNLFLAGNNCFGDEEIDLVMLAKNNTYQTFTAGTVPSNNADDDSLLYIKGVVLNNKNEPLTNKVITILSKSDNPVFYRDTTDNKGRFSFPFESYIDSTEFIIEIKDIKKGSQNNNKIAFDTIAYPQLNTPAVLKQYPVLEPALTKKRFNTYYQAQSLEDTENQLPTVIITDSVSADYDVSRRVSPFSSIIKGKDMDERISVDNAILKVGGLQLLDGYLVIRGVNALHRPDASSEPIIVVDGAQIPVFAEDIGNTSPVMSYLRSLNPKDIDFIEVLKGGESAVYGVRATNGVILINSVHRQRDLTLNKNNMQTFLGQGVAKPIPFPELNYGKKNKKAASPDYRSTVFWNGNLLTADTSNSTISFYTSAIPSVYNVTVTGVTAYGDIIYKTVAVQSK